MKSLEKRINKVESKMEIDPADKFDPSILTDEELKFYDETLERAGCDWNKEGDLSLLSDEELERLEKLHQKCISA